MTEREDFLAWIKTTLHEAEVALHNGDAAPRRALWSRKRASKRARRLAERKRSARAR